MKEAVEILQEIESEGKKGKTQFNLKRLNLIFEKIKAII
jgi:hypothetical protein